MRSCQNRRFILICLIEVNLANPSGRWGWKIHQIVPSKRRPFTTVGYVLGVQIQNVLCHQISRINSHRCKIMPGGDYKQSMCKEDGGPVIGEYSMKSASASGDKKLNQMTELET